MKGAESVRIVLKILALPFVAVLTITGAVFAFILFLSAWIFYSASFIIASISIVGSMIQGDYSDLIPLLIIAFVLFILPTVAEWIADRLADLNDSLKLFITT